VAIISFFLTKGEGAIGALDMPQEGRRQLALKSKTWTCPVCHSDNATSLPNEETAPSIRLESEPEITLTQVAASRADSSSSADKQLAKPSLETESAILENVSEESKSKAAVLLSSSSDSTTQREFIQESAQTQLIQEGTQVIQESIQTHIIQDELQHEASEASTMERLHRRRQEMIYKIDVAILSILALIIALIYRLIS
jgi:ubiquitin-conjugating enzyme E2 J1